MSIYAMRYQVLCLGVNEGPGGSTLRFAEKDATDIYNVFTSALGPPRARGYCDTAEDANRQSVLARLRELARQPPEFLLLYFSGHGSKEGILLSDGLLEFSVLAQRLRAINTRTTLIIFDTCHAAAYGGFVREGDVAGVGDYEDELAWAKMLAQSRPGTRMLFSTSATTLSHEATGNGRFTSAFLDALNKAPADMGSETNFVSALQAFKVTHRLMTSRWGGGQVPQKLGKLADFPLVKSQAEQSVGSAEITNTSHAKGISLDLDYVIRGRRQVATTLSVTLVDGFGTTIFTVSQTVSPTSAEHLEACTITAPADILRRHSHLRTVLESGGSVPAYWNIVIQDQRDRPLAEWVHNSNYKRSAPRTS